MALQLRGESLARSEIDQPRPDVFKLFSSKLNLLEDKKGQFYSTISLNSSDEDHKQNAQEVFDFFDCKIIFASITQFYLSESDRRVQTSESG